MTVLATRRTPASRAAVSDDGATGTAPFVWLLGLLLGLGIGIEPSSLPFNLQPVDLLLVMLGVAAAVSWVRGPSLSWQAFRRAAPWLWVIVCADLLAVALAGSPTYSLLQTTRDLYAFCILFIVMNFVEGRRAAERGLMSGLVLAALVCTALILSSPATRPNGTFDNPNYAANYLVAVLLMVSMSRLKAWKLPLLAIFLVGTVLTYSFGALSYLGVATCTYIWIRAGRSSPTLRHFVRTLAVAAVILILLAGSVVSGLQDSSLIANSPFDADRYDRSSTTRLEIWRAGLSLVPQHPFGVGPGSVAHQGLALLHLELHNDYLSYLVERGAIGLVGLFGLGITLWRMSTPGGRARVMLLGCAAASMTRETLNYRHTWVVLALLFLWDWRDRDRAAKQESDDQPDDVDAIVATASARRPATRRPTRVQPASRTRREPGGRPTPS